jgi:hypothetical protein
MAGKWLESGWKMAGKWLENGWKLIRLMENGMKVAGK